MRVQSFLFRCLIVLGGLAATTTRGTGVAPGAAGSTSEAADISGVLLDRFRPAVYFVDDVGPGGNRVDYPCSYVRDDGEIENNYAKLATPEPSLCYGYVHEQFDAHGKPCWVVEYDYYYPRNWSEIPPPLGCFTHEHDWEWIYIVVGIDGAGYRPYCACFSGHAAGNPDLFDLDGKVRLFPGVAGGSLWRAEWESHPEWAPRVSLGWDEHVEATALASGNAFDGSPTQPRSPSYWTHYSVIERESLNSSCSTTERFCYGDPGLALLCIGRSPLGECDDPREPPWIRTGLGAQGPLPSGFALPSDWEENPSTEPMPQTTADRAVRIGPNPCLGRLHVAFPAGRSLAHLELLDASGRLVRQLTWERATALDTGSSFDLRGLSSGIYLLRARWPEEGEEVHRVVLLR
jgi:hypothetical protein